MFEKIFKAIEESVPMAREEYTGEDGLLHCSVCNVPTETILPHPITGELRRLRCKCGCKSEQDLFIERQKREEIERRRRICFAESKMYDWTFDRDDRKNPNISDAMKNYADNFAEYKKDGRGLLLFGPVGTGKSCLAACVANALIDDGRRVLMSSMPRMVNEIQGLFEGKQRYIDSLSRYELLILDDLGVERKTEYMQETVYNIIDARYRSGLPLIVTTNLTSREIKNPTGIENERIYDRIIERCFPIEVPGESRRREKVVKEFASVKEKLGLQKE